MGADGVAHELSCLSVYGWPGYTQQHPIRRYEVDRVLIKALRLTNSGESSVGTAGADMDELSF